MFHCTQCKATAEKFIPKCPGCGKYQTYEPGGVKKVMLQSGEAVRINDISLEDNHRILTGTREFDRVLGDSKNMGMVQGSIVLLGGEPGSGKALSLDARILTPYGWVRMRDIHVHDYVIGRDGKPTRVLAVHPQGRLPLYRFRTSDGAETVCNDQHLWYTRTSKNRLRKQDGSVKTTAEIIQTMYRPDGGLKHSIPFVEPVEYLSSIQLIMHPYVLGMYLADGSYNPNNRSVRICKPEPDVIQKIESLLPEGDELSPDEPKKSRAKQKGWRIRKNKPGMTRSHTAETLRSLGLYDLRSDSKFVPEIYLRANIADRLELLRGLLDGDGHVEDVGTTIEYATTSLRLAQDVRDLVLGLGGRVTVQKRRTKFTNKHGKRVFGAPSTRLIISFHNPNIIPVSSKKHVKRFKHVHRLTERYVESIIPVGLEECQCITVAAADGLFVTDDYLVTHNSTLLLQVGCELAEAVHDPCKVLYVSGEETPKQVRERAERIMMIDKEAVPLTKMWFMASQKLDEIEKRVLDLDPDILIIDSLQTMRLPGEAGNMSQQENCTKYLQNLTKARGLTTFIVSHVTKEGGLAGPKQIEHLVDVVLSFDGERGSEIRTVRALKNRFGNTEEVGIFRMTADGLKSVDNPSEYLIRGKKGSPGSVLACLMLKPGGQGPGKRAVLFETQALLAPPSSMNKGVRIAQGYDQKRLNMLIAILSAHTPYTDIGNHDIYVNVTPNDFATEESSLDLPVALALVSSRLREPIPQDVVAWGEMGLTGEIRPNDYGSLMRKLAVVKTMGLQTPLYSTKETVANINDAMSIFPEGPASPIPTDQAIAQVMAEIEAHHG